MESPLRTSTRLHLPTLLWAVITAVGLLIPGPDIPRIPPSGNWLPAVAHFVLCFVLAVLLYRSGAGLAGASPSVGVVFAICFAYSGLLEVGQLWVPGRSFELVDFAVNGAGAAAGALAGRRLFATPGRPAAEGSDQGDAAGTSSPSQ